MQQAVQPQTVHVEWVRSQFTGELLEFLLDFLRNTNVKHAFHQGFNREQMGIDVLKVSHGLLKSIAAFLGWACHRELLTRGDFRLLPGSLLLLEILKDASGQGSEGLQGCPVELLLLTKSGELPDQSVVLPIEPLAVRTLAGLFRHRSPHSFNVHYGTCYAARGPESPS